MMDIKIIYEDSDILVLDKPAGIIVNRSETVKEETVQDWIEEKILRNKDIKISSDKKDNSPNILISQYPSISDFYKRSGIVHRIDKETSGLLLVAKNPQSFENLQLQFKERKVKKTYMALVHGKIAKGEGEIKVPVGRLPWNRKRFGVMVGGREAVTRYRVISNINPSASLRARFQISNSPEELSLLELYPETGRTHQIRVHLKYLGHPIFADELYAGRKVSKSDRKVLPRVFLHASKISFVHPKTGDRVSFESKLPEELERFINL